LPQALRQAARPAQAGGVAGAVDYGVTDVANAYISIHRLFNFKVKSKIFRYTLWLEIIMRGENE